MTNTDTDADPCRGCTRHPPRRGAADAEHRGELPAETRRRAKGGRGRL
jgi:hypothetical protein